MRKIYRAYKAAQKHSKASGIDFIRAAVEWFNNRPETLNEDKGPIRLLMDYAAHVLDYYRPDEPEHHQRAEAKAAAFNKKFCPDQLTSNIPPVN